MNQNRNDGDVSVERGLDFKPNIIVGVVNAPSAIRTASAKPSVTDNCEKHVAAPNPVTNDVHEVDANLETLNVDKDVAVTETLPQFVRKPIRGVWYVVPAIANEYTHFCASSETLTACRKERL
jgi:hypothetical protein